MSINVIGLDTYKVDQALALFAHDICLNDCNLTQKGVNSALRDSRTVKTLTFPLFLSPMIHFVVHETDIKNFAKQILDLPTYQSFQYKKVRRIVVAICSCLLLLLAMRWYQLGPLASEIPISVILSCIFVMICIPVGLKYYSLPNQSVALFRKTFQNSHEGIPYSVWADEKGLNFKTPRSEAHLNWSPEIKVYENSDYVFIFIDAQSALIINRSQVTSGSLDELLKSIKANLISA